MTFCDWLNELFACQTVRIIPILGKVSEQSRPIVHPLNSKSWPMQGTLIMAFTLTDSQHVNCTITFKDKKGNPAQAVAGSPPAWLVDNPNVVALTPAADGLSCDVAAVGPIGSANVTVNATITENGQPVGVTGVLAVTIVAGDPATVEITPGTPAELP